MSNQRLYSQHQEGRMATISNVKTAQIQANFPWTYVRVYTGGQDGMYGTGECFLAPGIASIIGEFKPLLMGEDPTQITRLVERMRWAASGAGSISGIVWNAISGIETALVDLTGKLYEIPACQLFGGTVIEQVPVYIDCHGGDQLESLNSLLQPISGESHSHSREAPNYRSVGSFHAASTEKAIEETIANAQRAIQKGYRILKFDLDVPGSRFDSPTGYQLTTREKDWMVRLVASLRDAVGPDIDLAFDAHWRYSPTDMLDIARAIELYHPLWLEDPLPPGDGEGLKRLSSGSSTAIATGENIQLREGFLPLVTNRLCDIVTPDVQKCGGMFEAVTIGRLAQACNTRVATHMIGSPIALAAAVHVCSALPNTLCCEFHADGVPFFEDLCSEEISRWFQDGFASTTDEPGLGVELNHQVLQKHVDRPGDPFGEA